MEHRQPSRPRAHAWGRECVRIGPWAFGALVAALLLGASGARAAPFVDVTYDLSDSTAIATIPNLNATNTTPPLGSISGTQTLRFASDSAGNLVPGPVDLLSFNLYVIDAKAGDYGYTTGGSYGFITLNTANLHFELLGIATGATLGQLLSGGTITPLGASGSFRVTGSVHCVLLCAAFYMTGSQTTGIKPYTFVAPLPQLTGSIAQPHTIYGTATGIRFRVSPNPSNIGVSVRGTTFLVGREISRTAVPEPGTLPLLAAGLGAIGLATAAWRRWARGG